MSDDFSNFGLDERLVRSIVSHLDFAKPTSIQSAVIPLALRHLDVILRARTGTGKTAAYSIPLLQKMLSKSDPPSSIEAVVLVPSRELTSQVADHLIELCHYCTDFISVLPLSTSQHISAQKARLAELPNVIVSTPARLLAHLRAGNILLKESLQTLVIDEADLMLSFGYLDELTELVKYLPESSCQTLLMSATLGEDLDRLQELMLHNPVIVRGPMSEKSGNETLTEHFYACSTKDKFLVTLALLKLRVLRGKVLIFVNDLSKCYKLKLLMDHFSLSSAVLNSELPQNSRYDVISQFDRGVFDILIATDSTIAASDEDEEEQVDADEVTVVFPEDGHKRTAKKGKKTKKSKENEDKEYSASRGVDFHNVSWVLNFDAPASIREYTHRVGRTARAGTAGSALLLIGEKSPDEQFLTSLNESHEQKKLKLLTLFEVDQDIINGLRYRCDDVLCGITKNTIKQARLQEIRIQLTNSETLASHFAEKPGEKQLLQAHDHHLATGKRTTLRNVPKYLVPPDMRRTKKRTSAVMEGEGDAVFLKKPKRQYFTRRGRGRGRSDPLKSFSSRGRRK